MWRIPLSDLNFGDAERDAVLQVLDSGWLTMGPRTQEFETWFAAAHQAGSAVALANCTCALELAYRYALETSEPHADTIIVPDITFVATANAVISAGGKPLLCDIQSPDAPYLCRDSVEALLKSRNDIAAVALVHYAGHDAGAAAMAQLCDAYGVALIEDCAHAPGALTAQSAALGTLGFAGCFSFFSNKNLATGEGGMLITDNENFRDWARLARSHGVTSGTWSRHLQEQASYDVILPGHNFRCTEITAALGLAQLSKLTQANERRRELLSLYQQQLTAASPLKMLMPPSGQTASACHIACLLCESPEQRNAIADALRREEIQTSHHYPAISSFTYYKETGAPSTQNLRHSHAFASRQLTLPLYPTLEDSAVGEITEIILSALA